MSQANEKQYDEAAVSTILGKWERDGMLDFAFNDLLSRKDINAIEVWRRICASFGATFSLSVDYDHPLPAAWDQ